MPDLFSIQWVPPNNSFYLVNMETDKLTGSAVSLHFPWRFCALWQRKRLVKARLIGNQSKHRRYHYSVAMTFCTQQFHHSNNTLQQSSLVQYRVQNLSNARFKSSSLPQEEATAQKMFSLKQNTYYPVLINSCYFTCDLIIIILLNYTLGINMFCSNTCISLSHRTKGLLM